MGTMQEHVNRAISKLRNQDDILRLCVYTYVFMGYSTIFIESIQHYRGATPKHQ